MKFQIGLAFSIAVALGSAACTKTSTSPQFTKGQVPFAAGLFDLNSITRLEIAKADPATGDAWAAQVQRVATPEGADPQWEITSAPGELNLIDRKAQSGFITHLLDTLKTLRISGPAPRGSLESFGLQPPRFALRWGTHEVRFGKDRYALIEDSVYEIEGATLKMLEYLPAFQSLRDQIWLSPLTADDVDEIEIYTRKNKGQKPVFYAQRDGSVWTDQQHKPVKQDISSFLQQIAHVRIQEFVDDSETTRKLQNSIQARPLLRVIFRGRNNLETQASINWEVLNGTKALYGTSSARPNAAFRIFSEALRFFAPFQK
jgi:hypothetical protein